MTLISRRAALVRGGVLLGAFLPFAGAGAGAAQAAPSTRVYKLVPTRACKACHACKRHGRNKLFATASAADAGRAHQNCRCRVRRTRTVNPAQREDLFGASSDLKRTSVDKRWPWVSDALGN